MKIVVSDTGPLISLGIVGKLDIIERVFGEFYIAGAVWEELKKYENKDFDKQYLKVLESHVKKINTKNYLSIIMDYGESESVILYEELNADYLLVDDNKARAIAESLNVNCIGSIGLLIKAKQNNILSSLRPVFIKWLENERYFSLKLLNSILIDTGEEPIKMNQKR
ncbi:MAG: DUF3368 domain-containing protein [Bacteroidia bacterium]